jgi:hypothetical protein
MRRVDNWGVVLGVGALAGTALLLGASLTRALRTPPVAAPAPEVATAEAAPESNAPAAVLPASSLPNDVLSLAVARAPFDPDRRAPEQRYLMPGERVVRAPQREERPEPPPAPDFRVLGTVAGVNGGVAVIAVEEGPPRVVAMGSEILGYRVASIGGGRVVMSGQGRSLALEVPQAAPTGANAASVATDERGNNNQQGNSNQRNQQREAERARAQERAQDQLRTRLEQLMDRIRQEGGAARVEMNGGRAVIVGPDGQRREIQIPDNVGRFQISPSGNITFQRGRGAGGGGE